MLTIKAILAAARAGREAVRVLCEGLTAEQLTAEIEQCEHGAEGGGVGGTLAESRALRLARAALETERDRRTVLANTPAGLRP